MNGQNKHFPEPVNVRAPRGASPAAPRPARRRRWPPASATSPSAPIRAARCARRPAIAGCGASARRMGACHSPRHAARALVRHGRLFRRRSRDLRTVAPVFLGEDERPFALSRLVRADDAFARLMSDREARGAAAGRGEGRRRCSAPPQRVTVAPEGLERLVLDVPPAAGGGGVEGARRLDRGPRPGHDARRARALRVRQDARRRRAADGGGEPQAPARPRRGDRRRPTAC